MIWPKPRRRIAKVLAKLLGRRARLQSEAETCQSHSIVLKQLEEQGISIVPDLLTQAQTAEIKRFFDDHAGQSEQAESGTGIYNYPLSAVFKCKQLIEVISSPKIMQICERYVGCPPILSSLGVRWSFPGQSDEPTQQFHRDLDDWRFLKLFVYLTDVDLRAGPHLYVKGSHKQRARLRANFYNPADDPANQIISMLGPAGTAFLADTYGIHAGSVPHGTPRLIIAAQYSLLPVYAFDYRRVRGTSKGPKTFLLRLFQ